MSVDLHRRAEILAGEADVLMRTGRPDQARLLYREAATLEAQVFQGIPSTRPKTRGVIAVSVVALYWKAAALEDAIRHAHQYLAESNLPDFAQAELLDLLLESYRARQAFDEGRVLGRQLFLISLRHGRIGLGIAPLDAIILKFQQIERYAIRVIEWVARKPFRVYGGVAPDVLKLCTPVISQPSAGSFQFELRFEAPVQQQLPLFESDASLLPDRVAEEFYSILDSVTNTKLHDLEKRVDDPQYREVFLKLVRNLAPDGQDIGEIEICQPVGLGRTPTILRPSMRSSIDSYLKRPVPAYTQEGAHIGVLRGLHLNEGWVVLVQEGKEQKYRIDKGKVLDDVVGPFVNRRVRAVGYWQGSKKPKFYVTDIVLDVEGEQGNQDEEKNGNSTRRSTHSASQQRLHLM